MGSSLFHTSMHGGLGVVPGGTVEARMWMRGGDAKLGEAVMVDIASSGDKTSHSLNYGGATDPMSNCIPLTDFTDFDPAYANWTHNNVVTPILMVPLEDVRQDSLGRFALQGDVLVHVGEVQVQFGAEIYAGTPMQVRDADGDGKFGRWGTGIERVCGFFREEHLFDNQYLRAYFDGLMIRS